jgi:fructoselysine-6-P-deglycase FrlB-like protein/predicted TIM-barrel fold metal-dependent hydrolase
MKSNTWDEIHQQPWLWRETAKRVNEMAEPAARMLRQFDVVAPGTVPDGVLIYSGLGSSHYIGRMIEDEARVRLGATVRAISSSELMLCADRHLPLDRKGILMSFSRSGESPEVVEAARRVAADFPHFGHIAVTCNAQGSLAKECQGLQVVLHEKSCDKGLAMTSSVTCMVLAGRFLSAPFQPLEVEDLAQACERLLEKNSAEAIAAKNPERVLVLGAAADEVALKILELTDGEVATLAQTFLDVRHGPISFLNSKTTVLAFLSPDPNVRLYEEDLLKQISGKGLETVVLQHPDPLLDVVFGQLVGYHLSVKRGLTPDTPSRRGIITRVVQGVTLYPKPPRKQRNPVEVELARRGGETLPLKDFAPVSMLKTRETFVKRPRFPVIDMHTHVDADDPRELVRIMDECGVERMINLSAATRDAAPIVDKFPRDRFGVLVTPDWSNDTPKEARRLKELLDRGACGLKIFKSLGLDPKLPAADDPVLDPIWNAVKGKYVSIHTGDPRAFFRPIDRFNERFEEQAAHPDWGFYGKGTPSWEELLEMRDRLFDRRRDIRWVSVHVGGAPEDLENVSRMLDRFPHVMVDIAARVAELGRQPYRAREFLIRYADRVLFGTDLPPHVETYRAHYRFLETDDEYFDYPSHASRQGRWKIYGLKLPDDVLRKIYFENAKKLLSR